MTKIILIRHAEPNYELCIQKGMIGFNKNLAPLTNTGIQQATELSSNPILKDAEVIITSPYTRSLQTASIISRYTNIPLLVDINLHEWLEDKNFHYVTPELSELYHSEFIAYKGIYPPNETRNWETLHEMGNRIIHSLMQYTHYKKIIVVSHGGVMKRLVSTSKISFCGLKEINFDQNFQYKPWTN